MRRDRELAFHAAEDPTPPDSHTVPDADEPRDAARHVVALFCPKAPERLSDGIARSPPARDVDSTERSHGLDGAREGLPAYPFLETDGLGAVRRPSRRRSCGLEQVRAECGLDDGRGMSFGHAIGHREVHGDIAEPPSLGRAGSAARPRPSRGPRLGLGPGMRSAPGPSGSAPGLAGPPRTRALRPV